MKIKFREAKIEDSEIVGSLVIDLTTEICERTKDTQFDINLKGTIQRCSELISQGYYSAIIGSYDNKPVAVVTLAETYALYAGGKIGVIQEFYVTPEFRSSGVGALLIEQVKSFGKCREWSCIELCTPPLPEFERTLGFYQKHGLSPVGGRKMRQMLG